MDQFGPLRCPACDYDLHGLPVPHRCPECGTQYDICRTFWRPTISSIDQRWSMRKLMFYCLIAVVLYLFAPSVSLGVPVLGALVLCGIVALFSFRMQYEHVRFDQTGVIVRTGFRETGIPWRRVSHAQRHLTGWQLWLMCPEEAVTLPPILASADGERDFHQALAAARNRWWNQNETRLPPIAEESRRELIGPLTKFERCPLCDRDIRGLPAAYNCPGCGFAYDATTRLWKPPLRSRPVLVGIAIAGLAVFPIAMAVKCARDEYVPRNYGGGFMLVILALAGAVIWLDAVLSRIRYVAIKLDGVHARTAFGPRFVPWTEIATARRHGKMVTLLSHRNRELLRLSGVFADEAAAEQFRRTICPDP